MLAVDRRRQLMEYLSEHESATRQELAQALAVTPMTIGRDFKKLEQLGLLCTTHGGAMLPGNLTDEYLYKSKKAENKTVKARLAAEAVRLVRDGMTIVLDAGTTIFEIAEALKKSSFQHLTVITCDLYIALHLYQCENIRVIILGGEVLPETGATATDVSVRQLEMYNADISFVGTSSVTSDFYLGVPQESKVFLKQMMFKMSLTSVLVVDKSKFGKKKLYKAAGLDEFSLIITDYKFTDEELDRYGLFGKVRTV
jgi:DeoR family fructose operon transcriptional repressor